MLLDVMGQETCTYIIAASTNPTKRSLSFQKAVNDRKLSCFTEKERKINDDDDTTSRCRSCSSSRNMTMIRGRTPPSQTCVPARTSHVLLSVGPFQPRTCMCQNGVTLNKGLLGTKFRSCSRGKRKRRRRRRLEGYLKKRLLKEKKEHNNNNNNNKNDYSDGNQPYLRVFDRPET